MEPNSTSTPERHKGPPLWLLAILYTLLFNAGLFPVTMLAGGQNWPGGLLTVRMGWERAWQHGR